VLLGEFVSSFYSQEELGAAVLRMRVIAMCAAAGEAGERGGGLLRWQEARQRRAEGRQAWGIREGDARHYAPVRRDFTRGDISRIDLLHLCLS